MDLYVASCYIFGVLDVYRYTDYRKLLGDFYLEKKNKNQKFSYRRFSQVAGLKSDNYLKLVMEGKRGLTYKNIQKFSKGMGLQQRESHYFENLVLLNQSKDESEKTIFRKNLDLIRSQEGRVLLSKDQYEVLSNWYPLAIRELTLLEDFKVDFKWIARKLGRGVTPLQVKQAIDQLVRLGFLSQDEDGSLKVSNPHMQTPNIAKSEAVEKHHERMLDLAKDSIKSQSTEERCLSGVAFVVRKEDLAEAFKRIHDFRNELDSYFARGTGHDSVYQLNIQLFRLDNDE